MNRKIWKALGIAVCMLALAAPRAMAARYEVGENAPFIKFGDAVDEINKSGDTENEIVLMENITLGGNYILTNSKKTTIKTTTIKGEGHTITVNPGAGITVAGEKTVLNLGANGYDGTLTIDGKTSGGFVSVLEGATANMYENVTLQNWTSAGNACVVIKGSKSVTGSKPVFNMHGGVIEKCSRAVMADSGATFNMSGGEIRNCVSMNDGGGLYADNSTINITGGTISGCEGRWGGGLYATNSSKITITGGTISECTAGMGAGGGLYATNSSEITSSGSTISECKASLGAGGGLYATNGSIINIDRGTISGCEAGAGGGLYADKSTVTISGGTISGCSATINNGGGLYATNSSEITISGGTISGCTGELGCGLYATNSSEITISGGTISGCTGLRGGGLYADNSTVTITGGTISRCEVGAGGGLFATNSSKITIRGGTISACSTTLDSGKGGGLYAENSTITISGGTIENNEAARGGGVALTDSTVKKDEKPIRNWTVVGNKAYKTGGGIWLGEKVEWDISDRTKQIYNNQAIEQGADIFLEGGTSAIKLPNAANMGAKYHDSGINIDNWYNDNPRYTPSENGQVVEANKLLNGGLSLVASYKASPVRIEIDANGGVGGSGSQTVQKGTNVTLEAPTKEGYLFTGWEDENKKIYPAGEDGKVKITVTGAMTLTAVWEARTFTVTYVLLDGKTRTETVDYGKTVTFGEEPRTGYTFVGWKDGEKVYHAGETITVTGDMTLTAEWKKLPSAENLPKTGDESPVLLWGAVLAVSAAACFVLRRRK